MRRHDFQPHTNALPPSPAAARGEGEGARQAPRGGGGARPRTQGIRIDRPHGEGGGDCPRGKIQANVMSRFGSAQDEVRVTAAGPPRDVRNAVAHRPEQKRASGSAPSGPWQALLTHSQCKGPAVRTARLEGNGPGDDRDVQNILMPLLLSKGMPPKRLGLIRNCLRIGCSSRVRGKQLT